MTNLQKRKQVTQMFGAYSKRLERLYDEFINRLTQLAHRVGVGVDEFLGKDVLFRFDKYPEIRQEYNRIFSDYVQKDMLAYRAGITDGVALAYSHDNAVLSGFSVLSNKAITTARNIASETFIRNRLHTPKGLNLSQLVWNYASQAKSEFEVAVSNVLADGLKRGTSAASLGLQVRQYLSNPDMMYRRYHRTVVDAQGNKKDVVKWRRRVVDENGKVRFVEEPLEKVGMGHYRSSKKNADRLMRTEINSAYHTANYERWQKEPFVIGIIIELSPQHPEYDECDELAGRYPKDFFFIGWHPQCLCMSNPITIQGEEKKEFYRRLAAGEDMSNYQSPNAVTDIPEKAKSWIDANRDKFIKAAERGKLGWVWQENMKYVGRQFSREELEKMGFSEAAPKPAKRIKTEAEKADIQRRWDERKRRNELIMKTGRNVWYVAETVDYVDTIGMKNILQKALIAKDLTNIPIYTKTLAKRIASVNRQLKGMETLFGNPRLLAQQYTIKELQVAHTELDEVMKNWLSKYNYASLDNAPLEHLKNKLKFEIDTPTVSYSYREIINKAIKERIQIINKKIEWEGLVTKAEALKGFKTKSPVYKKYLTEIDDAIQSNNFNALRESILEAEKKQKSLLTERVKYNGDTKSALNSEYKGGATGSDITDSVDAYTMKSKDPFQGTFTNNVAQMQGFDAPAKLVSAQEFAILEKNCGEVFYRTVNPTDFKGVKMSGSEFASQLYRADSMELNGPGGRAYGDGIYVATSSWNGSRFLSLSQATKDIAFNSSAGYGWGNHKTLEMTWTRKPNVIHENDLYQKWKALTREQQRKFGNHMNTYGCALGYDAMYCDGPNYMVIWNRSIIAVKDV